MSRSGRPRCCSRFLYIRVAWFLKILTGCCDRIHTTGVGLFEASLRDAGTGVVMKAIIAAGAGGNLEAGVSCMNERAKVPLSISLCDGEGGVWLMKIQLGVTSIIQALSACDRYEITDLQHKWQDNLGCCQGRRHCRYRGPTG